MYGTGVILSDFPIPRRNQQVCWRVGVLWNESKVSRNGNTEIYQITFLKYAKTKRGETMHKWDSSGRHTLHSKNTITFSFISCQEQNSPQCYVPVVIVGQIPMLSSSSFETALIQSRKEVSLISAISLHHVVSPQPRAEILACSAAFHYRKLSD